MIGPREVDRPLILYGYGRLGRLAQEIFKELGIPINGIFSNYAPLHLMDGKNKLLAICIATEPYQKIISSPIFSGWSDIVPVWDILEFYAGRTGIHNGWMVPWEEMPTEAEDECDTVSARFSDKESQRHYRAFFGWRTIHFEDDIVISSGPLLPSTLADIRARQKIAMVPAGIIHAIESWDIHAEGKEYETLVFNMPIFQKYRPNISCACYHSRDGLWKIEKYLMENLPDYQWTFRLHAFQGQAAYLYGVPKEKA